MISCSYFYELLAKNGFEFFTGVPDSLLKNFCFYVSDHVPAEKHIIAANEGAAVGLAAGYHLSTGNLPVVYLQNSGLGNTINPLLSLADPDVYSIPLLMIVGWRGEPGVKDEPQHKKQGRVMIEMLESMEIAHAVVSAETTDLEEVVTRAVVHMREKRAPYVLAFKEGSFGPYEYKGMKPSPYQLTREKAIELITDTLGEKDVIVSTTGKASRELYEIRDRKAELGRADFLCVGSMGHASQIALSVALQKPDRKVVCLDGDGAALMHLGGLATIGRLAPANYVHIMINNGAHESVGGQETGAFEVEWQALAKAVGYRQAHRAESAADVSRLLAEYGDSRGPVFLEVRTSQGSRKDLGRPKTTPIENKRQFVEALKS